MIPKTLLTLTESRAPGICVYGGPGRKKTHSAYTLPGPVLLLDFEGGSGSVMPWVARKRNSDQSNWTIVSQEERELAQAMTREEYRGSIVRKPGPIIDCIWFDTLRYESYHEFVSILGNLPGPYNSIVLDSMKEFSFDTQTFSKGAGGVFEPMELKLWGGAQERAAIALRRLKNLRDSGVVIYLIGTELIDKDYVTDPRSLQPGQRPEQPFSVTATVDAPGKLVGVIVHVVDILLHARPLNNEITWVSDPEPLPAGNCSWEAKDRFKRLERFNAPNFHAMFAKLYGAETRDKIYALSNNNV